jgi:hypothetical protein
MRERHGKRANAKRRRPGLPRLDRDHNRIHHAHFATGETHHRVCRRTSSREWNVAR